MLKQLEVKTEDQLRQISALGASKAVGQVSIPCKLSTALLLRGSIDPHSSLFVRVGKGCSIDEKVSLERLRDVLRSQGHWNLFLVPTPCCAIGPSAGKPQTPVAFDCPQKSPGSWELYFSISIKPVYCP